MSGKDLVKTSITHQSWWRLLTERRPHSCCAYDPVTVEITQESMSVMGGRSPVCRLHRCVFFLEIPFFFIYICVPDDSVAECTHALPL